MVLVSNAEGHRKMLAFEHNSPQPLPESNGTNNNLSHILISTISKKFTNNSSPIESGHQPFVLKNSHNTSIGPILPTYKSNSLNLSCIIEEEPPLGMMMSSLRESCELSTEEDTNNANLLSIIENSDTNLNPTASSSNSATTVISSSSSCTTYGEDKKVYEENLTISSRKKRSVEDESCISSFSQEKVSQSYDSPSPSLPNPSSSASTSSSFEKFKSSDKMDLGESKGENNENLSIPSPLQLNNDDRNANEGIFDENDEAIPTTTNSSSVTLSDPNIGTTRESPPHSAVSQKQGKLVNGTKNVSLKRVSFGSSKGSMVETLIFESPQLGEQRRETVKTGISGFGNPTGTTKVLPTTGSEQNDSMDSPSAASGGSTPGSRPPSRVRVTFFESEKPLALSSPESDTVDYDITNMTHPASPNTVDPTTPNNYARHLSVESGWDNPFRPDGDLSKEADQIVELIKEGKPINDETLRSKSPSFNNETINETINETMHSTNYANNLTQASPPPSQGKGTNGSANGMEVQRGVVVPPSQTNAVEHVTLKKKKGCCVIQ